ncbi:MAG: TonB-dependent receptor [Pseudomonadota bacterium]
MVESPRTRRTSWSRSLCLLAVLLWAAFLNVIPTHAQTQTYFFELPETTLSEALDAIAKATRLSIAVESGLVAGISIDGLMGNFTAEEALSLVLSDTGLQPIKLDNNAGFTIRQEQLSDANLSNSISPNRVEPERLLVLGTKLPDTLQDLEVSAEVFTAERLDRERIVDVGDIFLKTPNVNSRGGAGGSFTIRGIGRGGVGGAGQGVTSNVYIDGAPLASNGLGRGPTTLWDVQQVEVLRGPQSSVQGRNALSGAAIITTADPTYELEGKLRASFATNNTQQFAGAISGPLIDDTLAARLAVDYQKSDGFITNTIVNRPADRRESLLVRSKFLFEPESLSAFRSHLIIDYQESDIGESRPIVSTRFGTASPAFEFFDYLDYQGNGRFPNNENKGLRVISDSSYEIDDNWTVRGIFTYEKTETDRLFGDPDFIPEFGGITFNQFDEDVVSAEIRFDFEFERLRGLLGGYWFDEESVLRRDIQSEILPAVLGVTPIPLQPLVNIQPATSLVSLQDGNTTQTQNVAIFGQVEFFVNDEWTVNIGFRYDDEEYELPDEFANNGVIPDNCTATLPAILLNPTIPDPFFTTTIPCTVLVGAFVPPEFPLVDDIQQSFSAFLPRIAVTYNINEDSAIFASFQRGYRAGGSETFLTPNTGGIGFVRGVNQYDPEFLDTFEIGSRNLFLDGSLTLNANVFYSSYDDAQIRLTGENAADSSDDVTENAGEATLYGAELFVEYAPTNNASIFLSLGYLNAEYDDYPFAVDANGAPVNAADPRFANLAGNTIPNAPELSFSIGGNYEHPSGFFVNASISYIDEQFDGVDNLQEDDFRAAFEAFNQANGTDLNVDFGGTLTEVIESRIDLTARIGYQGDEYEIYVFGTNLLDDESVTNVNYGSVSPITGELVLIGSTQETVATVNRPRVIGLGIDMSF